MSLYGLLGFYYGLISRLISDSGDVNSFFLQGFGSLYLLGLERFEGFFRGLET